MCSTIPTMTNTPRIRSRRRPAPKPLYTYCPFRPGVELKAKLDRLASLSGLSVSEIVRRCCAEALPVLEKEATR